MPARESRLVLTDAQRQMVLEYFAGGEIRPMKAAVLSSLAAMVFVFLLAGGGFSLLIQTTEALSGAWALCSAIGFTIAVGIAVFTARFKFEKKSLVAEATISDEVLEDLEAGEVAVLEVHPEAVACISERGSEGLKYCYRVGDGRAMILREEDLVFEAGLGRDYNRAAIRILSLPKSSIILDVELTGEQLTCDFIPSEVDQHRYPSGKIFDAEWKEVVRGNTAV